MNDKLKITGANGEVDTTTTDTLKKNRVSSQTNLNTQNPTSDNTDYYSLLKQENYKAMLNKDIQASNARDQALKYTQNALRNNGYANQGLSESSIAGINNTYQNALNSARSDYNTANTEIDLQKLEYDMNKANSGFESLTTLMDQASQIGIDNVNNVLSRYKIDIAEDGTLSGDYFNSLDKDSQDQLQVIYDLYKANADATNTSEISDATLFDYGKETIYYTTDGQMKTGSANSGWNNEVNTAKAAMINGEIQNGDYVKLANTNGESIYLVMANNELHYVNKQVYDTAKNKKLIYGSNGKVYDEFLTNDIDLSAIKIKQENGKKDYYILSDLKKEYIRATGSEDGFTNWLNREFEESDLNRENTYYLK